MDEQETENTKYEIIMSGLLADHDLCEVNIEVSHDVVFFNNPGYLKKSIVSSGLPEIIWSILSNEVFENHPIREFFKKSGTKFEKKYWTKKIAESFKEIPGIGFYEIKHDDKRSTLFFEFSFFAVIAQLRVLPEYILEPWTIFVRTQVGNISLI